MDIAAAVDHLLPGDGRIDQGAQLLFMAEGRHIADNETGKVKGLIGSGKLDPFLAV